MRGGKANLITIGAQVLQCLVKLQSAGSHFSVRQFILPPARIETQEKIMNNNVGIGIWDT